VVEGPSAAGKTTWCRCHADGRWLPEPEMAPLPDQKAYQRARWRQALAMDAEGELVVLDGDPFKYYYDLCLLRAGLVTEAEWHGTLAEARQMLEAGELGFADLVLYSDPGPDQLRQHRDADSTRRRSNFELHVSFGPTMAEWYRAIDMLEPGRVIWRFPVDGLTPDLVARGRRQFRSGPGMLERLLSGLAEPG